MKTSFNKIVHVNGKPTGLLASDLTFQDRKCGHSIALTDEYQFHILIRLELVALSSSDLNVYFLFNFRHTKRLIKNTVITYLFISD